MAKRAQMPKSGVPKGGRVAPAPSSASRWLLVGVIAAVVILAAGLILLATSSARKPIETTGRVSEGLSWGPADAKVTIVEYSDFGCSHCRDFAMNQGKQLREEYEASGKVRFLYQPFVLNWATTGAPANAALCAADQGKFWDYHDVLFQQQGTSASAFSPAALKSYGAQLGLDATSFNRCVDDSSHYNELRQAQTEGSGRGVSATPTFFINGQRVEGAQPYLAFKALVEAALGS